MCDLSLLFLRLAIIAVSVSSCFETFSYASQPRFSSVAKCWQSEFPIPRSPDLSKCSECDVDETGTLSCLCQDDRETGTTKKTSLAIYSCPQFFAFPRCADEIEVKNGQLSCKKISPESTYARSCFSCTTEGTKLTCTCWEGIDPRQKGVTELDMKDCDAPISSCEGMLTCGLCDEPEKAWVTWSKRVAAGLATVATIELIRRVAWRRIGA